MNITYKFRSFSIRALNDSEMASMRDISVKEISIPQGAVSGFVSGLIQKAKSSFPWLQQSTIDKIQASMPLILSHFKPGETVRLLIQLNVEIAGFPIASRSLFSVHVIN